MIRKIMVLPVATILLVSLAYSQGKPPKCTNPQLDWKLEAHHPLTGQPSGITDGDGKGVYSNGADGVTAIIEHCGSGKADATLDSGNREIAFTFGSPIGIGVTPNWDTTGPAFLRIGNIRAYPLEDSSQEHEFTTWMTTNPPSPNKATYKFRMFNPDADFTGELSTYPVDVNQPYVTAKVYIYHCPAKNPPVEAGNCAGLTKETWFVYPDPTPTTFSDGTPASFKNVGTLVDFKTRGLAVLGQYEVPFYFVISVR